MADDKRYMGFWIGHLHEGERNRIQAGQLNPHERDVLAKGEDPWAKFRGPLPPSIPAYVPTKDSKPILSTEIKPRREPTVDELRQHMPAKAREAFDNPKTNSSEKRRIREKAKGAWIEAHFEPLYPQKPSRKREQAELESEKLKGQLKELGVQVPHGPPAVKPPKHIPIPEIPPDTSKPEKAGRAEVRMVPVSDGSNANHVSLWPSADEQHARGMQAAFENKPEQTLPRSHRISRVLAGGLFALFSGSIIQALTLFGVITMNSGHVFMLIALVAGVLIIATEILPLKPTRHKVGAIVILVVVLGLIDFAAAFYAYKQDKTPAPLSQSKTTTTQTTASPIVEHRDTTLPLSPELQGTNAETRTIYNRVTTNIRDALRDYQKTTGTSMYVVVPDMPTNLLSSEVLQYKGAVTFSQHAAWYIHLEKETSAYATLVVEFMNGDGTTVSGSGIGAVRFSYDPGTKTMNITADGTGKAALGKAHEKMSASSFRAKASEIVNSLFQYQLDHL